MPNIELTMQVLATLAIVLYLLPRLIGGRAGAWLGHAGAALLAAAFILALVETWFWYAK
jgi:hypothetical protein